jgi:hypothetical protein
VKTFFRNAGVGSIVWGRGEEICFCPLQTLLSKSLQKAHSGSFSTPSARLAKEVSEYLGIREQPETKGQWNKTAL